MESLFVLARRAGAALGLFTLLAPTAWALTIDSVSVDRPNAKIVVRGADFNGSTAFTLGGVAVVTANVGATQLDIPFDTPVYAAVQWRGSYRLEADGSVWISVYFREPVEEPVVPPPPPPPPPPGDPDCPCIDAWQASGIPKDGFTLCFYNLDGTQESTSGQRDQYFISTAFDPYNIFFDPVDPGNSVSYCALHDGNDWTVAEPVVNQEQFDDCDHWLWLNICI